MNVLVFISLYVIMTVITAFLAAKYDEWVHGMYLGDDFYAAFGLVWPVGIVVILGNLLSDLISGRL